MRIIKTIIFMVVLLGFVSCQKQTGFTDPTKTEENKKPDATEGDQGTDATVLWKENDEVEGKTYVSFRIPTLLRTPNKLFAFIEARMAHDDRGDIDIVYRVSKDNGKTWGESELLFSDGDHTVGNFCAVYTESGRICALFNWQHMRNPKTGTYPSELGVTNEQREAHSRRVFYTYSDDEGETWSKPLDITETVMEDHWTWNAVGPVHAIQLKTGKYKGRIVFPCDLKTAAGGNRDNLFSYVIYSDDNCKTFQKSEIIPYGNESTVVELSDGRLHLDMRNANSPAFEGGVACRAYSISEDGGATWGPYIYDYSRPEPTPASLGTNGCQGVIENYTKDGIPTKNILFMNPADPQKRHNLTLRWSKDDGFNWRRSEVICSTMAGYSDMVVLKDGSVAMLYENGIKAYDEKISFRLKPESEVAPYF